MKIKKILMLVMILALSTTTFVFANDVKIIERNGQQYIPLKSLVKNLGGVIKENKSEINVDIKSKKIKINSKFSFAKVDETYYPLENKKVNGFNIPVDKKPLVENKDIYVSNEFFKNINILEFKLEKGKLITSNNLKKIQSKEITNNQYQNNEVITSTNEYKESNKKSVVKINNIQVTNRQNNNKTEEKSDDDNVKQYDVQESDNKTETIENNTSQTEIIKADTNDIESIE